MKKGMERVAMGVNDLALPPPNLSPCYCGFGRILEIFGVSLRR